MIGQAPPAGAKVAPNTVVTLLVAVPPANTIVPDLRHETIPVADGRLYQAHLTLGPVLPALSMTQQIVSQLPVPGSMRPRGTQVTLTLAGPANVVVPKLQCLTLQAADSRLYDLGLKLLLLSTTANANSLVQSQIPGPGQKRPPGTAVMVSVNGTRKACQQPTHPRATTPSSGLDPPPSGRDPSPDKRTATPSKAARARTAAAAPRPARTPHSTARASSSDHGSTRRQRPHG